MVEFQLFVAPQPQVQFQFCKDQNLTLKINNPLKLFKQWFNDGTTVNLTEIWEE